MTERRKLWEDVLAQDQRRRSLLILLLDYIDLLGAELDETALVAHVHGWRSTRHEEGNRLRAEIEKYVEKPAGKNS